jgi:site-specific DNA-methyltransferase (adenine-specific)
LLAALPRRPLLVLPLDDGRGDVSEPVVRYLRGTSPDALRDLPDGCASAIVTDPPYGLAQEYGRRREDGSRWGIANDSDGATFARVAFEMHRLLDRFGVALVFAAPTEREATVRALEEAGFRIDGFAPWDKGAPGISYGVRYAYEECVIASKFGTDRPFECRDPLVVPLREPRVQKPEHPNEKPVRLLRRYVRWACPEGGLVVDPFAGIASCGVAAIAERCSYVGVECDERWWPIAERRLADAQDRPHPDLTQASLFGDTEAA